jgi:hypothetical protein
VGRLKVSDDGIFLICGAVVLSVFLGTCGYVDVAEKQLKQRQRETYAACLAKHDKTHCSELKPSWP